MTKAQLEKGLRDTEGWPQYTEAELLFIEGQKKPDPVVEPQPGASAPQYAMHEGMEFPVKDL